MITEAVEGEGGRTVQRPDGFLWIALDGRQDVGPFKTLEHARADMLGAARESAPRDAYLAGLIAGVPALTTGASRTPETVELIKSNAKLSSLSRNIHTLSRLLAQNNVQKQWPTATCSARWTETSGVTSPRRP